MCLETVRPLVCMCKYSVNYRFTHIPRFPKHRMLSRTHFTLLRLDSLVAAAETDAALSRSIKEMRVINQNGLIQLDLPKADKGI